MRVHSTARTPAEQRDKVLDALTKRRREAIEIARLTAHTIARENGGTVTAPEVLARMRKRFPHFDVLDPRYVGAVLLPSLGWRRTTQIRRTGSKARPVPVWRRA